MKCLENSFARSYENVLSEVGSSELGLNEDEVLKRLNDSGYNKLPEQKKQSKFVKFLLQFKDLMIFILFVASIISFCVGEILDACIILAIVFINAIIGFAQQVKAEKSLESLKKLTEPYVKVMRAGVAIKIKSEEVVVGDILVLEAGDIVCADARIIESAMLKCDESSLTGESEPILKNFEIVLAENASIGDRVNMVYSGSVITYGRARAVVVATGQDTQIGKIASMLSEKKEELTPLQKSLKVVGKIITCVVIAIAVVAFVLELFASNGETVLDAFLTSVALAVAAIPESLPSVVTIIMALGVTRLTKNKAIVKKLHAVETLGACDVICSDKTGTLTQNKMTVKSVWQSGKILTDIECDREFADFQQLLKIYCLCNDSNKVETKFVGDPTETALTNFAYGYGFDKENLEKLYPRCYEIPFDSERKLMSTVNGKQMLVKGGIDELLCKCSKILYNGNVINLDDKLKKEVEKANTKLSGSALRVLASAYKDVNKESDYTENDLTFVGLIGMIDPPRDDVQESVVKCKRAGMRPIMITGDHKQTAFAIARQIGIANNIHEVLSGAQIDELTEKEFLQKLQTICVFARVSPENKVRIVEGFKKLGKVVAMTGDGVNDAPSIKRADIGVGMGITGTDITKEVADIIVTDDSFATIIIAVEEGRKIYKNIQKTINFLFASNICEVLSLLIALIFFPDYVFLVPIQILFTNLISDSLPALALGVEPADKDNMISPPRKSGQSLLSGITGLNIILQGLFQTAIVVSSFIVGRYLGGNAMATTMAFFTLNLVQIFFIYTVKNKKSLFAVNPFANWFMLCCTLLNVGLLAILGLTSLGQTTFGLCALKFNQWLIVLGFSFAIIPINEAYKAIVNLIIKNKTKNSKN